MPVLRQAVAEVMGLPGATSCAIVDIETGECLARLGVIGPGALETAGLVNARMLRAKLRMVQDQDDESIEDILITLDRHYHIIRLIHCGVGIPCMFIYLVLDRTFANLAIARRKLALMEYNLVHLPEAAEKLESSRLRALNGAQSGDAKVHGGFGTVSDDSELPAFMRDDVAIKLLGINVGEETHEW